MTARLPSRAPSSAPSREVGEGPANRVAPTLEMLLRQFGCVGAAFGALEFGDDFELGAGQRDSVMQGTDVAGDGSPPPPESVIVSS